MGCKSKAGSLRHARCPWAAVNVGASEQSRLAFVALGANLDDPSRTLAKAVRELRRLSDEPLLCSSFWETSPVDCPPGSPRFINAVVGLAPRPDETPESLLSRLQELERQFGRKPKQVINEPRPLDLDLIAFGNESRTGGVLILPHPRAHLRRFVLKPLSEIAPDLVLPKQSQTVTQLLENLPTDESIRRIGKVQNSGKVKR